MARKKCADNQSCGMEWPQYLVLQLIDEYRANPILWVGWNIWNVSELDSNGQEWVQGAIVLVILVFQVHDFPRVLSKSACIPMKVTLNFEGSLVNFNIFNYVNFKGTLVSDQNISFPMSQYPQLSLNQIFLRSFTI